MRKFSLFLMFLLSLFSLQHAKAQDMSGHIAFNEADIKWGDAPAIFPKGAQMAVLQGDPSTQGEFTVRLKMPANYKIPPHWHPTAENVTVIKGEFYIGTGDKLDEHTATSLKTGGFASIPAMHHHFAFCKGECIVQVHAMGPFQLTYINPADDPSKKK